MDSVQSRIKARRKELDLSADDVATALGVSRATIYRYESADIEKLPATVLQPLANVLRTTPAYLMGWNTSDFSAGINRGASCKPKILSKLYSPDALIVADAYDKADAPTQRAVKRVLDLPLAPGATADPDYPDFNEDDDDEVITRAAHKHTRSIDELNEF